MNKNDRKFPHSGGIMLARMLGSALAACTMHGAGATEFDIGDAGVKVRWDNTFKYSSAFRVKQPSAALTADANQDDGDRNFRRGLVSNRLDLLSELDLTYGSAGLRVSGAAWYDSVYRRGTDHDSAATFNGPPAEFRQFPQGTRTLHGRKAEWLDAFVFGKLELGEASADVRAGRHTLLYGESLFFGSNGIAGTQSPLDIVKLLSVPGSQVKEIIRPVGQVSAQVQLSSNLSVGAYVQYEWEQNRLPGAGSYFSFVDHLDAGGERVLLGAPLVSGGGPAAAFRAPDQRARDGGQFGAQLRTRVPALDTDIGLYATRSHARDFQLYIHSGAGFNPASGQVADYQLVYPEGIKTFGASASRAFGAVQVGAEASVRRDTPLVSNIAPLAPGVAADNHGEPRYAVGNSAHFQVSTVVSLPRMALWEGGFFLGELAWNRVTSVTRNRAALDPNTTRDAWALRFSLTPQYFQVLPGLDLSVPLGVGYSSKANSGVVSLFNPGGSHGGDLSIGVNGTYRAGWQFGLGYTHYFGRAATFLSSPSLSALNFGQQWKDRDFISFNVQRAF
ncbi:MAG: DUF1302 domain-containing protein [Pseudomonadota bacterium]